MLDHVNSKVYRSGGSRGYLEILSDSTLSKNYFIFLDNFARFSIFCLWIFPSLWNWTLGKALTSDQCPHRFHPSVRQKWILCQSMTKPTKSPVLPAKSQISLGICPVWSQSSVFAWRSFGSLATHKKHSKVYDQTAHLPRLDTQADLSLCCAHMSFCWVCHTLANLCRWHCWLWW